MVNRQLAACRKPADKSETHQGSEPIGSSLEVQVHLEIDDSNDTPHPLREALDLMDASPHPEVDNLADWLLVSALRIGGPPPVEPTLAETKEEGVTVRIARATGSKCERCWHHEDDIGSHPSHPSLCGRCVGVLERQGPGAI